MGNEEDLINELRAKDPQGSNDHSKIEFCNQLENEKWAETTVSNLKLGNFNE